MVSESPEERIFKSDIDREPASHGEPANTPLTPSRESFPTPVPRPEPPQPEPSVATPQPNPNSASSTEPSEKREPIPSSFFEGVPPLRSRDESTGRVKPSQPAQPDPSGTNVPPLSPSSSIPILSRAQLEQVLAERESELLAGPALTLDLDRLGRFIRTVGGMHTALGQEEERYPSSRTVCLRWSVRGHSVLTGFESPRNVYFWNNLLQQSLASNRKEKIAAFSHSSEPFDPSLFAGFGFSPAVIHGRVDIIQMSDRELAMIYAADRVLRDHVNSGDRDRVAQLITLHLDPLWRRIIQPL